MGWETYCKYDYLDRFKKIIVSYENLKKYREIWNNYLTYINKDNGFFNIDVSKKIYNIYKPDLRYPMDAKYVVVATHDIDNVYPSLGIIKYYLKRNPIRSASLLLGRILRRSRIFLNMEDILRNESRYGFSSTFYLLVSDRDVLPFYRSYYNDPVVEDVFRRVSENAEMGLHIGYYSYDDLAAISREKKRVENMIGKKICGTRNHYLNLSPPRTWRLQAKAGFIYDTTLGYKTGFGYPNRICYPFIPFDNEKGEWINIVELPLTIMDRALVKSGVDLDKFMERLKRFIESSAVKYGCFITLLWHNDMFVDPRFKKLAELYWRIIDYVESSEGVVVNAITAVDSWLDNVERNM